MRRCLSLFFSIYLVLGSVSVTNAQFGDIICASSQDNTTKGEDHYCVSNRWTLIDPNRAYQFFCVFDGHGGRVKVNKWHNTGKEKAEFAVDNFGPFLSEYLKEHIGMQNIFPEAMRYALSKIDHEMFASDDQLKKSLPKYQMPPATFGGTTANIILIEALRNLAGKISYLIRTANIGDSRSILINNKGVRQLSYDHCPSRQDELERIIDCGQVVVPIDFTGSPMYEKECIRTINHKTIHQYLDMAKETKVPSAYRMYCSLEGELARSDAWKLSRYPSLSTSRSLGDTKFKYQSNGALIGDPEITSEPLDTSTDSIVVLATDGIWDVMDNLAVMKIASAILQGAKSCSAVATDLLQEALNRRALLKRFDDATAMVLRLVASKD